MKSKAARLLEKMGSVEKKTVYDVNGAQEVKEKEQKKMEKPCKCESKVHKNSRSAHLLERFSKPEEKNESSDTEGD